MKIDTRILKDPPSQWRGKTFWALNGKLDRERLKKQIACLKEMGLGGAFLHSRIGLQTEYMSEEWLSLIEYAVDELHKNGMEAYLYDEDRWPSGTCGGMVTQTKEYRAKYLSYKEWNFGTPLPENTVAVFVVERDKQGAVISFRKAQDGEDGYAFYWAYMEQDSFYNGYTYVDTMYRKATERFIELTHERYKAIVGEKFGKEIIGIFTDEPHRGPFLNGFTRKEIGRERQVPYTFALFEEFEKRKGYKIEDNLPLIWFGRAGDKFCKETYDLIEVLQQLFVENYAEVYHDWCQKNKLIVTGHVLHEDSLVAQATMCGSVMRYYPYMDFPGMDNLLENNYAYTVVPLVTSVARQYGKSLALSEMYGATGWKMRLVDYKNTGDWQSAMGINLRCLHHSLYTLKGEAKRDCPASIFYQSSWYKEFSYVESYFARIHYLLSLGESTVDTAFLNPVESVWGLLNERTVAYPFTVKDSLISEIENAHKDWGTNLVKKGLEFDYLDEGLLSEIGSVENGCLVCGKAKYKKIVLNANYHIRGTTLLLLREFVQKGGKLFLLGEDPQYVDGKACVVEEELLGVERLPADLDVVYARLSTRWVETNDSAVLLHTRKTDDGGIVHCLNTHKEDSREVVFTVEGVYCVTGVDLRNGTLFYVDSTVSNGKTRLLKTFDGAEEFCFLLTKTPMVACTETKENYREFGLPKTFSYTLSEDNYYPLKNAVCIVDGTYFTEGNVLQIDCKLRDRFGIEQRHGEMVQPWAKEKNGQNKKHGRVALRFSFTVEEIPERLFLMGEELSHANLSVNGQVLKNCKMEPSNLDVAFDLVALHGCPLYKGENTVEVSFDFYDLTNMEAYYLYGSFGVAGNRIVGLPEKLALGDLCGQGLPYYGGCVTLLADMPNGYYRMKTDDIACALVKVNGKPIVFSPFETCFRVKNNRLELQLWLTRENLFEDDTVGRKTPASIGLVEPIRIFQILNE